ncbi:dTDP-4-dehydrorhamnose reductase [Sedimentisphaera salicampi]|uniref:dTDP-4-dehydrorhamnose reductase n=1 Tax=Sedimentisphaera salicampi TaxID=1941349 RepID=A0A1W6LKH3_9BACT|nr:dTDP-4-dehydrorhamnose reductase [Sedimentisphaera salicampi]ARN56298.1 dTDP-4-dehydrorhamnose reductase [Sedimentisphaera salicampi]
MKVLIVGAKGQLGTELQNCAPENIKLKAVDIEELDISQKELVNTTLHDFNPEVVINASAYTAVDRAEQEEGIAFKVNCEGVANLALASKGIGARVIHISTDYVFDGRSCKPYLTSDSSNPQTAYGRTKLAGEKALAEAIDNYIIIRTSWLYSPNGSNFVKTMLRLMTERDELSIVADQIGTPTSSHTLAKAVWEFTERDNLTGVYHCSDSGAASWYDFAHEIMIKAVRIGLLEDKIRLLPITTADYPTPAERPMYSVMDKTSLYKDLGIEPIHWADALEEVLLKIKEMADAV